LGGKISGVEIKQSERSILTIPYLVDAVVTSGLLGKITQKDGKSTYVAGYISWTNPVAAIDELVLFLTEYLNLFRLANLDRWELGKASRFASNPGVAALIRFAGDLIAHYLQVSQDEPRALHAKVLVEKIAEYAHPAASYFKDASDEDLERRFQIPFGSGGPRVFQHRLRELVGDQFPAFDPPGYRDDLRKYDAVRTRTADQKVRAIQESVHGYVVETLKQHYGPGEDYLEKGIDSKEILKKAYEKRIESDDKDRKDMGTYFDFIDLKKIIEGPKNWPYFADKLDLPLVGERKGKMRHTNWFVEVNKTRRISAHPYNRGYSDEEVAILDHVYNKLKENGVIADDAE
jgi:hypothetical protein